MPRKKAATPPPPPPTPPVTEDPTTYQDVLDQSLEETFPASDPIAPHAATHAGPRAESERNAKDWKLQPGSEQPPVPQPQPAQVDRDDDSAAESLGKAVTAPVRGAADESAREQQIDEAAKDAPTSRRPPRG